MVEVKPKPIKKYYRILPNEGKITFRIEELWKEGTVRKPFGSNKSAIKRKEVIAKNAGLKITINDEYLINQHFEKSTWISEMYAFKSTNNQITWGVNKNVITQ